MCHLFDFDTFFCLHCVVARATLYRNLSLMMLDFGLWNLFVSFLWDTVDGRNPAPPEMYKTV